MPVSACTFTKNSAFEGGAFYNRGSGNGNAQLMLTDCTLSENSASESGGGILNDASGDDAGLGTATLTLQNTILAGNSAPTGPDLGENTGAETVATGTNLISTLSGSNIPGASIEIDVLGSVPPRLAPLGHYGGPTQTMHPLERSEAIRSGDDVTRTDQRGFTFTGPPTVGAVKIGQVQIVGFSDDTELRAALAASENTQGNVIRFFADSVNDLTFDLSGNQLEIPGTAEGLFIDGSFSAGGITLDAGRQSRIMEIQPGATAAIHAITFTGGVAPVTPSFSDARVGGAIYNNNARLSLSSCTFSENSAALGGGIFSTGASGGGNASLTLTTCTLARNSATGLATSSGGALFSTGSNFGNATLSLSHCTLSENDATSGGGGIRLVGAFGGSATLHLSNTILAGNLAPTEPDLSLSGAGAAATATGNNLVGDSSNSPLDGSPVIFTSNPGLAPLGFTNLTTLTKILLPGSPAIDAATTSTRRFDQRGVPIIDGSPDIGAVEFQGTRDLFALVPLIGEIDHDGDGSSFAFEFAIGTDPFLADRENPANLSISTDPNGNPVINFGVNPEALGFVAYFLERSTDLENWETENPFFQSIDPTSDLPITDTTTPAGAQVFYRLRATYFSRPG